MTTEVKASKGLDRRGFMSAAGGLVLACSLPFGSRRAQAAGIASTVNSWIQIGTDESITIYCGSSEMGQGVMSGLAQILAEDLMVDWTKVKGAAAAVAPVFYNPLFQDEATGGSASVAGYYQTLRVAGAAAREMLKSAAAQTWGVSVSLVTAAHGTVINTTNNAVLTYGKLAPLAATLPVPTNPPLVPSSQFQLIGKPLPRTDLPSKTDGSCVFGIDVQVPGMVFAVIVNCPVIGGTLKHNPPTPPGAIAAVPLGNAVAVVASNTYAAMQAAAQLQAQWTRPAGYQNLTSSVITTEAQQLMITGPALVAETQGNVTSGLAGSAKQINVTYQLPYLAHACMEPLNCTVSIDSTGCKIWAPTQSSGQCVVTATQLTGLPSNQVQVFTTYLGAGLGRKGELDFITQGIQTAMALGKPVKLTWPREQDFSHDMYRPMTLARVEAGIDTAGNVMAFWDRIVSPSILAYHGWLGPGQVDTQATEGATGLTYNFANRLTEWVQHPAAIPVSFWRSVGYSINSFVVESAIDELAALAGIDPYAYRQKLLAGDTRSLAVLNAVATLGNWNSAPPAGHARGMAISNSFGTVCAHVVEVTQPNTKSLQIVSVATVVDPGMAINPDTIEAQMESAVVHGLTACLYGQITFKNGVSQVRNYDRYQMLRMSEMPKVTVQILQSGAPIGGIGEPGVPAVAPAVMNAFFKLTGTRIRTLPMFPNTSGGGG